MSADYRHSSIMIPVSNILLFLYTIKAVFFILSNLILPLQILILDPRLGVYEAFTKISKKKKKIVKFRSIYIINSRTLLFIFTIIYIFIFPFRLGAYVCINHFLSEPESARHKIFAADEAVIRVVDAFIS